MDRYGIIVNRDKDIGFEYTRRLVESIKKRNGQIRIAADIAGELGMETDDLDEEGVLADSDLLICIGGDGTLLGAARKAYRSNLPILGINLGNLGFLTEIEKNDIDTAVEKLFQKEYCVEERMMLKAIITNSVGDIIADDVALNDVTISRIALSRILNLKMYINGAFVDSFPGDGLIVSSPTGSTAYSMSAGGPIVEPDMNLMILTPICPHILYSRSFITKADSRVKVMVEYNYENNAMVTLDGQKGYRVSGGYTIEVIKSPETMKLIRINSRDFFTVLRTKIYERGENLRKNEI